jgi:hypothetical protein
VAVARGGRERGPRQDAGSDPGNDDDPRATDHDRIVPRRGQIRTSRLALVAGCPHNLAVTKDVLKRDLEAAIETRRELGDEMEPVVIDAFVARIEQRIADRKKDDERALKRRRDHQKEMVLGSMGISIPLFAIAAVFTGLLGIVAVCVVLVIVAIVSSR